MPGWGEDELLECRGSVSIRVLSTDVKRAFGVLIVGGVLLAVLDAPKFEVLKKEQK